jgi:hypothetical protein
VRDGIQVSSNEDDCLSARGENDKKSKNTLNLLLQNQLAKFNQILG